ncbi:MAG TPA: gamma-glutamyl-gamma-aminobutyrate hydrolase family protein [Bacteroidota bacterium]|nr:gamma-glutamyl-gamma-aminobutyrate hydrolase family protein [Bacteroidota bacterium]
MMRIAVADTMGSEHKFQKYVFWLRSGNADVECVRLSYEQKNAHALRGCGGLLLTGGHDVDPALYGGKSGNPVVKDVDRRRDDFELGILRDALDLNLPLLAICRGMQLVNVHFGGTLIPDLEGAGYRSHKSTTDASEYEHEVNILDGSHLHRLVGFLGGTVNSSHHQAVDRAGEGLAVSARSVDGVIESLERNSGGKFLLLVQWHPERMHDSGSPFSAAIRKGFLSSVARHTRELKSTQKE